MKKKKKIISGLASKKIKTDNQPHAVKYLPQTKVDTVQLTKNSTEEAPCNSKSNPEADSINIKKQAKVTVARDFNPKIINEKQIQHEISKKTTNDLANVTPQNVDIKSFSENKGVKLKKSHEVQKHRYNIRMILHYSNATPIRTHYVGNGYACCFCDQFFYKAADLKTHTIRDHEKKEKVKFMQGVFVNSFLVKLDITALRCNLCKLELNVLEDLIKHLKKEHNKPLYTDIKSQVICFKLDNEDLKCMFCQVNSSSFKRLLEHATQHYRNFVCDICDAGFINQRMLYVHAEGHKLEKGQFECETCKKVFDKSSSLKYHERTAHSRLIRNKCFQCHEKFATVRLKKEHMIEIHGVEFKKLPCLACDKTFKDKNALRVHTQRDHLMERRFKCSECEKTFFTNGMLKNHMTMHTGTRDFKCQICGKDFARKITMKTHMRTHK